MATRFRGMPFHWAASYTLAFFLILMNPTSVHSHTLVPLTGISAGRSGAIICFLLIPSHLFKTTGQNIPKVSVGWITHAPSMICSLRSLWWAPLVTVVFPSAQACYCDRRWHLVFPLPGVLSPSAAFLHMSLTCSHPIIKMPPLQ